ncbi:hypothetical protein [Intestinimonas butyriciproducens]|uniref:hypothetical protein n=1 Tax=Intestinimonas butyriciproducens TaxID=1297617 RepID=UPI0018AB8314|nr:hypothetical protein [Intestinimonas butyriciproducens]MDB7817474.1 hypothetical protein [Intestinimonas butyriciproducens]MDB7844018.1 hypothetical protein [Intestinimonas butyriciproducens]MDB7858499.1 hypothetical protein [Intestinimonas butyriciproducens]
MNDILSEIFNLVEDHAPEAPRDHALEQALRGTMSPEQLRLFEAYQEAEFHREETDREALFRFLLHTP